jgi:hypothetical protein
LKAMPPEERQRLLDNLKKFDLIYTPDQQRSLMEIDRRLNELEPERRDSYLAALRRYHNWLGRLPDSRRDELNAKAPAERMALVKKLVPDNPVPRADTPFLLRITDLGDHSPFELAAFFKIWQALTPAEKQQVEKQTGPARAVALAKRGASKKLPTEIAPPDFAPNLWTAHVESTLKKNRPATLVLFEQIRKKDEGRASEIFRRLAANLYFVERPPPPVKPDRLADFLAAFPNWLQSAFLGYPPDEARRRLTAVYRVVYPHPAEMKLTEKAPAPAVGRAPSGRPPAQTGKTPRADGDSPF